MTLSSIRICAFGELGSGKSLVIVREMVSWLNSHPNSTIYSNMVLNLPHVKIDNPEILFDIEENAIVILDELWHIADSRKSMSVVNDIMNMLLLRSRKKNWFVGYTQQHYMQTDKRIRYVTELWIEPQMRGKWLLAKYYSKEGVRLGERLIDGSKYWDLFVSESDPYTLNVEKLRSLWDEKNRRF